jgi:hypothetical protein
MHRYLGVYCNATNGGGIENLLQRYVLLLDFRVQIIIHELKAYSSSNFELFLKELAFSVKLTTKGCVEILALLCVSNSKCDPVAGYCVCWTVMDV